MSYETYHIPVNFTDAGKLFGVFEIRNAVETVLLCIPILFLCLALLPLTLMPKIIGCTPDCVFFRGYPLHPADNIWTLLR